MVFTVAISVPGPPHGCSALCVRRKIPVISPVHLARRWLNDVMGDDKFKWA